MTVSSVMIMDFAPKYTGFGCYQRPSSSPKRRGWERAKGQLQRTRSENYIPTQKLRTRPFCKSSRSIEWWDFVDTSLMVQLILHQPVSRVKFWYTFVKSSTDHLDPPPNQQLLRRMADSKVGPKHAPTAQTIDLTGTNKEWPLRPSTLGTKMRYWAY